jgi:hypothetical protein
MKKRWQCTWSTLHTVVLHVHCHLFFIFHYTAVLHVHVHLFFMLHYRVVLHVLCHLLFYVSLHTAVLHVHSHLFFIFQEVTMYMKYSSVVKHKKEVTMYTKYSFVVKHKTGDNVHIITSFLCFSTQSCTSCTLSPLFYISLHTELYFMYIVTSLKYSSL